ncbi:3-mercaptopyruvate sulfurtransferase [Bartonella sp. LJL80]
MIEKSRFVVSTQWLEEKLGKPNVSIVDGSWYLPATKRDPRKEFEESHIPGAVFFDQDKICDETTGLPHSLPTSAQFARDVGQMGISNDDTIVVYDGVGFFSAPRVWWMFRVMGAKNVVVLDGGFERWKGEGRPVERGNSKVAPKSFLTDFQQDKVVLLREMRNLVDKGSVQIADARSNARFTGAEAEPRSGMRSGHMPGAHNIPSTLMSSQGAFKDLAALEAIFKDAGVDIGAPIVTTCGSGVTAAVLALALESLGNRNVRLYDGSWSEWGAKHDTPVVTGNDDEKD